MDSEVLIDEYCVVLVNMVDKINNITHDVNNFYWTMVTLMVVISGRLVFMIIADSLLKKTEIVLQFNCLCIYNSII